MGRLRDYLCSLSCITASSSQDRSANTSHSLGDVHRREPDQRSANLSNVRPVNQVIQQSMGLPVELWLKVAEALSFVDVQRLTTCCKFLRQALLGIAFRSIRLLPQPHAEVRAFKAELKAFSQASHLHGYIRHIKFCAPPMLGPRYNFIPQFRSSVLTLLNEFIPQLLEPLPNLIDVCFQCVVIKEGTLNALLQHSTLRHLEFRDSMLATAKFIPPQTTNTHQFTMVSQNNISHPLLDLVTQNLIELHIGRLGSGTRECRIPETLLQQTFPNLRTLCIRLDKFDVDTLDLFNNFLARTPTIIKAKILIANNPWSLNSGVLQNLEELECFWDDLPIVLKDRKRIRKVQIADMTGAVANFSSFPKTAETCVEELHIKSRSQPPFERLLELPEMYRAHLKVLEIDAPLYTECHHHPICHCLEEQRPRGFTSLLSMRVVLNLNQSLIPDSVCKRWIEKQVSLECPVLERIEIGHSESSTSTQTPKEDRIFVRTAAGFTMIHPLRVNPMT